MEDTIAKDENEKREEVVREMKKVIEERENETAPEKVQPEPAKSSIIELANNSDFSVATIAKEADRINRKEEGEVFISLHFGKRQNYAEPHYQCNCQNTERNCSRYQTRSLCCSSAVCG